MPFIITVCTIRCANRIIHWIMLIWFLFRFCLIKTTSSITIFGVPARNRNDQPHQISLILYKYGKWHFWPISWHFFFIRCWTIPFSVASFVKRQSVFFIFFKYYYSPTQRHNEPNILAWNDMTLPRITMNSSTLRQDISCYFNKSIKIHQLLWTVVKCLYFHLINYHFIIQSQ